MKLKTLLILPVVLFITNQSVAQFSIGIKSGISNAWEYYGDVDLPEGAEIDVNGYYFSVLGYYDLSKNLSIGIEPGFVQRGAACVPGWSPFIGDTEFNLNYIETPVFLRGNIGFLKDRISVFGKVGFGGSYLQHGVEIEESQFPEIPDNETVIDFEGKFKTLSRYDYGAYGGAGIAVHFGATQLFIEGNYYHALKNFDSENISQNRSLQLGLGVSRNFGSL